MRSIFMSDTLVGAGRGGMRAGIKTGMRSLPSADQAFDDLGSKVCDGFFDAVANTREDLIEYRRDAPRLAARHSATGLANWIADQFMENLADVLFDVPGISFVEGAGHTREVLIPGASGRYYRFRAKRHKRGGAVATYPTDGALDFMTQEDDVLTLFDYSEVRLTVGYMWDPEEQEIGEAVVSLRDDMGKRIVWVADVPGDGLGEAGGTIVQFPTPKPGPESSGVEADSQSADGPSVPIIELPRINRRDTEGGDEER